MLAALQAFGAPLFDLTKADLLQPDTVFQIGGITFEDAWRNRITITVGALAVPIIGREDFITNKRASGRDKDLSDLTLLPPRKD